MRSVFVLLPMVLWLAAPLANADTTTSGAKPVVRDQSPADNRMAWRQQVMREYENDAAKRPPSPMPASRQGNSHSWQRRDVHALASGYPPSNSPSPKKQRREAELRAMLVHKQLPLHQRDWLIDRFSRIDKKRNALMAANTAQSRPGKNARKSSLPVHESDKALGMTTQTGRSDEPPVQAYDLSGNNASGSLPDSGSLSGSP